MLVTSFFFSLLGAIEPASAATTTAADCLECCQKAGMTACGTDVFVNGEGSKVYKEGSSWRVSGLYVMSCDGRGFFDDGRTALFSTEPAAGDLAKAPSAQWACFRQTCQLPVGLCLDGDAGHISMCDTGAPPTGAAFRGAPGPRLNRPSAAAVPVPVTGPVGARPVPLGALVVVVAGKTLAVELTPAQTAPAGTPAVAASPPVAFPPVASPPVASPAPVAAPAAAVKPKSTPLFEDLDDDELLAELNGGVKAPVAPPAAAGAQTWTPSANATYTPSPTASPVGPTALFTPAPGSSPATASNSAAITQLTEGLPRDPPDVCHAPSDALHSESRKQVMTGDDLRLAKDVAGAIQKYRAAISMDLCNGYGWIGLGEAAISLGRPDLAIRTLRNGTMLMPQHYGAWLELGQAYEAIHEVDAAIGSYQRALSVKPGLPGAVEGLSRLGVR